MINSVAALCRSLRTALEQEVLPQVADAHARGQLAAALYALANVERQADWSALLAGEVADIGEHAIEDVSAALGPLGIAPPDPKAWRHLVGRDRRLAIDRALCSLFDGLEAARDRPDFHPAIAAIERRLLERVREMARHEARRVAPSMMKELSGG